ncbi:MAG: autotransporter domain-containing protein, partial [Akkermansia sp.]
ISSQSAMGKYSRTWNGLLLGVDRQLCCHATLGVAFGYENSIARAPETKFDTDTYFIDLYSAVRTGSYDHKLSVGVGIFDFDTRRGITVSAPGHDFAATAQGSMTAHSINVGYELSRDFVIESQNAVATPFLDVNYAYIDINNLREHGAGEASLNTQYDNLNLVQLGLGARYTMQFRALPQRERGTLTASASAVFELSDRSPDAINRFAGADGLPFSVESSKRDCFYGQFGLNATIPLSDQLDLVAGGYGRVGAKRGSVTGNVGLRYEF